STLFPYTTLFRSIFYNNDMLWCTNNTHIIMSALFSASPTLQKCTTCKKAQDSQCSTVVFAIEHLEHCKVHFYADDTILYASAPSIDQAVSNLQHAFDCVHDSLKSLKLILNASKTI